jgi:1,4-alpha-glucan branching enzyme
MARLMDGHWEAFAALPPGRHRYKFFVNDRDWIADPQSRESAPDGFGGRSSVVVVK